MMDANDPIAPLEIEEIALIGMACRFPGARNTTEFWQALCDGTDLRHEFTDAELTEAGVTAAEWSQPNYVRAGLVLERIDQFDAGFFEMSPRQAQLTDPQQRFFLECAWEALESAAIDITRFPSAAGIFAGASQSSYYLQYRHDLERLDTSVNDLQTLLGNDKDYLATQTAYKLNLKGPCVNVQTACSTGLVAVHLACQSLLSNECDLALAGGVTINAQQTKGYFYQEGAIFSPDGHCRPFDADAQGTVFGSGVGIVVLKRLHEALTDGDTILAVIKGSAINNDGAQKVGFSAPSVEGQTQVIAEALAVAAVDPNTITYVEAHGTGTPIGDPIELRALTAAYADYDVPIGHCAIGAVKSNVGHLETAAGMAGLIKTVLMLQHQQIPAVCHFQASNPAIDFAGSPFYVNTTLRNWVVKEGPRRAGVSSFGIGGTNAHIILEEAPVAPQAETERETGYSLLPLSAKTPEALTELAARYHNYLYAAPAQAWADICYTAAMGRTHFPQRLGVVAATSDEAVARLAALLPARQEAKTTPKIAFLFTGQGSQYIDMGRELYDRYPVFRAALDRCDKILHPHLGQSLLELLYPDQHQAALTNQSRLDQTAYTQPALFAVEYALAQLWMSWGIQPAVVLGHSVGEYVAACLAEVFRLEDGLRLIAERGRLMQALPTNGAMIVVAADEAAATQAIAPYHNLVSIAALNGPDNTVISGTSRAIELIAAAFAGEGIKVTRLDVSHAFHSPLMEPILDAFEQAAGTITLAMPQLPLLSNLTGKPATAVIRTPTYWRDHIRRPVRFADSIATLSEQDVTILIEIGPKPVLLGMVKQIEEASESTQALSQTTERFVTAASLRTNQPACQQLLESVAKLYAAGVTIDWAAFTQSSQDAAARRRVTLPTYPFQHQRHWIEPTPQLPAVQRRHQPVRPLIDRILRSPAFPATIFETTMSVATLPFLTDHRIYGDVVVPGACQVALALSAAELLGGDQEQQIEDLIFTAPLSLPESREQIIQLVVKSRTDKPHSDSAQSGSMRNEQTIELLSFAPKEDAQALAAAADLQPITHATGRLSPTIITVPAALDRAAIQTRCCEPVPFADFYNNERPVTFGPAFQWITQLWRSAAADELCAELQLPATIVDSAEHALHPALLDGCFQVVGFVEQRTVQQGVPLPFAMERCQCYQPAVGTSWWCHARRRDELTWDLQLADPTGQIILKIDGFQLRTVPHATLQAMRMRTDWLYALQWQPQPLPVREDACQTVTPTCWLVVDNTEPCKSAASPAIGLADQLRQAGQPVHRVMPTPMANGLAGHDNGSHTGGQSDTPDQSTINANDAHAFVPLLSELAERYQRVQIVYFGTTAASVGEQDMVPEQTLLDCSTLLHLLQALDTVTLDAKLWIVTAQSQALDAVQPRQLEPAQWHSAQVGRYRDPEKVCTTSPTGSMGQTFSGDRYASHGALWGLGRTVQREVPALQTILIDLDTPPVPQEAATNLAADKPTPTDTRLALLVQELLAGDRDQQVAYRNGTRYVAQLTPWSAPADAQTEPHRMQLADYGTIEQISTVPQPRQPLQAGEIEVHVHAAGLNLRDVLNVLGLLRDYYATVLGITAAKEIPLGFECAGVVSRVGAGVTNVAEGDRVMGLALGAFADFVTAPATNFAPIPTAMSTTAAATIPLAFLTAWYGLVELGGLQRGDNVLIHAAAGGVGQAAVQIAQAQGATVYATASPAKWPLLRAQGVTHLMNSRTLDFADELLALTAGQGVDLVLNSLSGAFIAKSLDALAVGGRFVELGKREIWSIDQVAQYRSDVHYCAFDLGEEMAADVSLLPRLWQAITARLASSALRPLPGVIFSARQIQDAFRYMQQARHSGKIVLTFTEEQPPALQPDGSYLITGGLGALGLEIAQQLAADGARHLILCSRHTALDDAQATQIDQLRATGVEVMVASVDVADRDAVWHLLEACHQRVPIRGIVHAAGLLADGLLPQQSAAQFAQVLRPKVDGAWHLHTLTQQMGIALEFFICFSSTAALSGAVGQANYAAANAFLDALMQQRRQQGLAGLSINWGPWQEIGMAARLHHATAAETVTGITPQQGRMLFTHLRQQSVAQMAVLPTAVATEVKSGAATQQTLTQATKQAGFAPAILQELEKAHPEGRRALFQRYLRGKLAELLRLPSPEQIQPRTRFFDFGLDSLMAVELRNLLEAELGRRLRSTLFFDYPTLDVLTPHLIQQILGFAVEAKAAEAAESPADEEPTAPATSAHTKPAPATLATSDLVNMLEQELALLGE